MAHSGYFTFEYPYYQRFIFDDFVRSDICFYVHCIALHWSALLKPSESALGCSQVVLLDICVHNNKGNILIIAKLIIDFVISIPLRTLSDDISVSDDWADVHTNVQWRFLPMPV